jgi:hypothetical protein
MPGKAIPAPPRRPAPRRPDQARTGGSGLHVKDRTPQRNLCLAALATGHPPKRALELAPDPARNIHSRLDFEPVAALEPAGICFGLLASGYLPRSLELSALPVKRGRWGAKPAEELQLLQPLEAAFIAQPGVRRRGILRSLPAALADLLTAPAGQPAAPEPVSPAQLWLAAELALHGQASLAQLRHHAAGHGWAMPDLGGNLVQFGDVVVWRAYAQRLAAKLAELLAQPAQANPFRRELSRLHVARLLHLPPAELAAATLAQFAEQHGLKRIFAAFPETYALSGSWAAKPPSAPEAKAAKAILAALPAGEGLDRRALLGAAEGAERILPRLVSAEVLTDLMEGYLVRTSDLRTWLAKLPARPGRSVPAVRAIKDRLGASRRLAEALRRWYAAQAGAL